MEITIVRVEIGEVDSGWFFFEKTLDSLKNRVVIFVVRNFGDLAELAPSCSSRFKMLIENNIAYWIIRLLINDGYVGVKSAENRKECFIRLCTIKVITDPRDFSPILSVILG